MSADGDIRAAGLLAEAWGPALSHSYRMGHETGWSEGWRTGYNDKAEEITAVFGVYRDVIGHPLRVEIEAAQSKPIEACTMACGRCSACIHVAARERNHARYGSPDFPGLARCAI